MLHLWGRMSSINVRKAVWAAQELGLDYQRTEAGGMHGIVQTPEYKQLNTNSLVPVMQEDGFVLWESNVIVRYLCAKHSSNHFYPEALPERFDAERWMDWQQTTVNPAGRPAFWQLIRTPSEERSPALIAESNAAVEVLMARLDAHLQDRSFMVAERFTMADIPLGCEVHRWLHLPQAREPRPHIERWFAALQERPAAKGILDIVLT